MVISLNKCSLFEYFTILKQLVIQFLLFQLYQQNYVVQEKLEVSCLNLIFHTNPTTILVNIYW